MSRKTTKTMRPLAISPSAAVQKQKKKVAINKLSPSGKLRLQRPTQWMTKLDEYCWGPKPRPQPLIVVPPRLPKKSSPNPLKVLKTVSKAKVEKNINTKKAKQQKKSKLLHALQSWLVEHLDSTSSVSSTPAKPDPFALPSIFKGKNGKNGGLRGPDSIFASPDFDASAPNAHTKEDPEEQKASMTQEEERQQELKYNSSRIPSDRPVGQWKPDTFGRDLTADMQWCRKEKAFCHGCRKGFVNDVEMSGMNEPESVVADKEMVDAKASSSSIISVAQPFVQQTPSTSSIQDSPMEDATMTSVAAAAAAAAAATAAAPPSVPFAAPVLPHPSTVSTASTASTFNIAAMPLPNSARGCQPKADKPTPVPSAPISTLSSPTPSLQQSNGVNAFSIAVDCPSSSSSRACQHKAAAPATPTSLPMQPPKVPNVKQSNGVSTFNVTVKPSSVSSRGCQRQSATVPAAPPHNSGNIFSIAAQPPPTSARGCQPSRTLARPATQNSGVNTFDIAMAPPPSSARGCQRKPAVSTAEASTNNVAVGRPVEAPLGAHRAVPLNLTIGESTPDNVNMGPVNTYTTQPHPSKKPATTMGVKAGTIEVEMAAALKTPLPPSAPTSPLKLEPEEDSTMSNMEILTSSATPAIPRLSDDTVITEAEDVSFTPINTPTPAPRKPTSLRLKLRNDSTKIEEEQKRASSRSTWQPKTWDRTSEKKENCGTWKKQTCPAEWKVDHIESLIHGDGEYDKDLSRIQKMILDVKLENKTISMVKDIIRPVIEYCMGQADVEVPIETPKHVSSIPKLAEAPPGSSVSIFDPARRGKVAQKELDTFEDDMIELQLQSPKVWEWLIGFVIQKGCSLQKLLIAETLIVENGKEVIEEDADIYNDVVGNTQWSVNWRRVDDLAASIKHKSNIVVEKFYEATDLVGMSRQDFNAVLEMIESKGYFETFADQIKQWAVCHKKEFWQVVRKAGLCKEQDLEELVAVKQWLWIVAANEHESFLTNIEACLQCRYPHWYERFGETEEEVELE